MFLNCGLHVYFFLANYVSYAHYYVFLSYVYFNHIIFTSPFLTNYIIQFISNDTKIFTENPDYITYDNFVNCLAMDTMYPVNILNSYFPNNNPWDHINVHPSYIMFMDPAFDFRDTSFVLDYIDYLTSFDFILEVPFVANVILPILHICFNFFAVFSIFAFFFVMLWSKINNLVSSKTKMDAEQLASQLMCETEKEIASFDDLAPLFLSIFFTFG